MNNKKSVLGRGLASILRNPETDITTKKETENNVVGNVSTIKIENISTNPFQPRTDFDDTQLEELAKSIKQLGIIQPITVRKLGINKYQLISGERRLRASKIVELSEIPAFIRIANDQQMLEMALVENIQRSNLNPIEVALSYQRLIEECKLTQEKCSERVGKKRSTIANFLRLLKLPDEIQSSLQKSEISMGHARALINVKDKETQLNIFHDAVANGFSVREVEQIVKTFGETYYNRKSKTKAIIQNTLPFFHQQIIHSLSKSLDKEVEVKRNKTGKGNLIIPFNSDEDFTKLMGKLNK
ncbi:MAG: ParB/RepB/Spo0J family partition protein [Flavobacteriales bacterium]